MADPKPIVMLTVDELREIIRGEVAASQPSPMPRFLNVSQCADWLDCTTQAIGKWCREDGMPFVTLGSERRFEPAEVVTWMRSRGRPLPELPAAPAPRHLRAIRKG
jgi:hypothetical protein